LGGLARPPKPPLCRAQTYEERTKRAPRQRPTAGQRNGRTARNGRDPPRAIKPRAVLPGRKQHAGKARYCLLVALSWLIVQGLSPPAFSPKLPRICLLMRQNRALFAVLRPPRATWRAVVLRPTPHAIVRALRVSCKFVAHPSTPYARRMLGHSTPRRRAPAAHAVSPWKSKARDKTALDSHRLRVDRRARREHDTRKIPHPSSGGRLPRGLQPSHPSPAARSPSQASQDEDREGEATSRGRR